MTISLGLSSPAAGYLPDLPPPRRLAFGFACGALFVLFELTPWGFSKDGSASLLQIAILLAGSIFYLASVHRLHEIVSLLSPAITSPSTSYSVTASSAVVRHFFPFYNLAWLVIWPYRMARFLNEHLREGKMASGLLIGFLLLFALILRGGDAGLSLLLTFWLLSYVSSKVRRLVEETEQTFGAPSVFE